VTCEFSRKEGVSNQNLADFRLNSKEIPKINIFEKSKFSKIFLIGLFRIENELDNYFCIFEFQITLFDQKVTHFGINEMRHFSDGLLFGWTFWEIFDPKNPRFLLIFFKISIIFEICVTFRRVTF